MSSIYKFRRFFKSASHNIDLANARLDDHRLRIQLGCFFYGRNRFIVLP